MATALKAAVESYLRAKTVSRGTRNEYFSTVRSFLDWVHERAVAEGGTNSGRTANKAREHLPESSVEILGHSVGGITYRHYAHRAPLAFKAIMTIPQPTAFSALIHGHEGECPCCRRRFADAG
jgi:hypothetical protein